MAVATRGQNYQDLWADEVSDRPAVTEEIPQYAWQTQRSLPQPPTQAWQFQQPQQAYQFPAQPAIAPQQGYYLSQAELADLMGQIARMQGQGQPPAPVFNLAPQVVELGKTAILAGTAFGFAVFATSVASAPNRAAQDANRATAAIALRSLQQKPAQSTCITIFGGDCPGAHRELDVQPGEATVVNAPLQSRVLTVRENANFRTSPAGPLRWVIRPGEQIEDKGDRQQVQGTEWAKVTDGRYTGWVASSLLTN